MQGIPLRRTMSADGRFAYTLYDRPEGSPFIHALDTARGTAACIDLSLSGGDLARARPTPPAGRGPLLVRVPGRSPLAVDVAARRARPLSARRSVIPARERGTARDDLGIWLVAALVTAAVLAVTLTALARRRRRPAASREMPA
jgi:hypothetical protein